MEGKSPAENTNKKMPSLSPQDVKQAANDAKKSLEEGMAMTSADGSSSPKNFSQDNTVIDSNTREKKFPKKVQEDKKKAPQNNEDILIKKDSNKTEKSKMEDQQNERLQQASLISRERATDNIVKKDIGGDYYIRTMQHDLDESKGKKVSVVNVSRQSIEEPDQKRDILNQAHFEPRGISDKIGKKKNLSQEGKIGEVNRPKTHKSKSSFLDKIKNMIPKGARKMTRRKFSFIITFFIFIFIIGIGYHLYSSGALSSLSGIGQSFKSLIGWEKDNNQQDTTKTATSSLEATTTLDHSDLPVTPTSTISTSTSVSLDESKVDLMPAFFQPDQTQILALNDLGNLFEALQEESSIDMEDNSFKRVGLVAQDDLGSFSLAKAWEALKSLAQGENNNYTELISGEVTDNWGLAMPGNVYRQISEKYNLFLFGQPVHDGSRAVLIFKVKDATELQDKMSLWEITMLSDLRKLFLGIEYGEPATDLFQENTYRNASIRYLNLPQSHITLDYAVIPDFNYLILATSRESIWRTVDKIIEAKGLIEKKDTETQAKGKLYLNDEIGFQLHYPAEEITIEERNQEEGVLLALSGDKCDITNNPECPMFMWVTPIYSAQQYNNLADVTLEELIQKEFGLDKFQEFNVNFEQSAQTNYVDVINSFAINENTTGYFLHNWVQSIGECHYFTKHSKRTLDIVRSGPELNKNDCATDQLFNQILKTIKFND